LPTSSTGASSLKITKLLTKGKQGTTAKKTIVTSQPKTPATTPKKVVEAQEPEENETPLETKPAETTTSPTMAELTTEPPTTTTTTTTKVARERHILQLVDSYNRFYDIH